MARHVEVIDVALPIEEAFATVADFARTADWDPGVVSSKATTKAPLRKGSRFRVEVGLLGRTATYGYAITEFEPPSRVVLHGGDGHMQLFDEITLVSRGRGTRITWEVRCELSGIGRLANPLLDLALPVIVRRGAEGLRRYARTVVMRDHSAKRGRKRAAKGRKNGERVARGHRAGAATAAEPITVPVTEGAVS